MEKKRWKKKIKASCEGVGTYKKEFDAVIDSLAEILERRDACSEQYEKLGSKPIISHTNKGGNTNIVKNPMLVMWNELNAQALNYWRDLGLTPKGLKAIDETALKPQKRNALMDALRELDG